MRTVNRIAAVLLGIVLLAGGLLIAAEAALLAAGRPPWLLPLDRWHAWLSATALRDSRILGASIIVGVLGLVVLAAQLRPWPPQRLRTSDGTWWVERGSVEQRTAAAVAGLVGVHHPRARVRGSERRWRLQMNAEGNADQRDEVIGAVRHELDRLSAPPEVAVNVALRRPRRVT